MTFQQRKNFIKNLQVMTFEQGTHVFSDGLPVTHVYLVKSGECLMFRALRNRKLRRDKSERQPLTGLES
jgi:CRP-like cAMP-binding protein